MCIWYMYLHQESLELSSDKKIKFINTNQQSKDIQSSHQFYSLDLHLLSQYETVFLKSNKHTW